EVANLPESRDRSVIELPELFLVEAVESCELQRCSIIQGDVEQDRRQEVQGEQGGNELLGGRLSRDELLQDAQNPLQIGRIRPIGIDNGLIARRVQACTVEIDAQNVRPAAARIRRRVIHSHVE